MTQSEAHSATIPSTEGSITEAAGDDMPPPSPNPVDNPFDGTQSDPSIAAEVEVTEVSHQLEQASFNENLAENGEEQQNGKVQVFYFFLFSPCRFNLVQIAFLCLPSPLLDLVEMNVKDMPVAQDIDTSLAIDPELASSFALFFFFSSLTILFLL